MAGSQNIQAQSLFNVQSRPYVNIFKYLLIGHTVYLVIVEYNKLIDTFMKPAWGDFNFVASSIVLEESSHQK